jgi:hypothetical protein
VYAYLTALTNSQIEQIHDLHHVLEGRRSHVLPALVETPYPMCEKLLRNVAKSHSRHNPIATKGMLTWFLQV